MHLAQPVAQKKLPQVACCGTSAAALAAFEWPANTAGPIAHCRQKLKSSLWPVLLALTISACASSSAELKAAQLQRDKIANGFDLTADGWQHLGVNEEQQARYRKLAEDTRKGPKNQELAPDSLLNRLFKALLGTPPE